MCSNPSEFGSMTLKEFKSEFSDLLEVGYVRIFPTEIVFVDGNGAVFGLADITEPETAAEILRAKAWEL